MKKLLSSKDFKEYFNQTDSIVAATIANDKIELIFKNLFNDPTRGAVGEHAEGYRSALQDILNQLGD